MEQRYKKISSLKPTNIASNNRIKAQVTFKSPLNYWSNASTSGSRFTINLKDDTGEIKAIIFNDKYHKTIQCNKVYIFSNFTVKSVNKKYVHLNHECEINFTKTTYVSLCANERVPDTSRRNYIPISQIPHKDIQQSVDIIGICWRLDELRIFKKDNRELKKRDVVLLDDSHSVTTLTLWGKDVDKIRAEDQAQVISVERGSVKEHNGSKHISLGTESLLQQNPDIPECQKLREWYASADRQSIKCALKMRNLVTLREARNKRLDRFVAIGTVYIVDSFQPFYKACTQEGCSARVNSIPAGYDCDICKKTSSNFKFQLRLMIQIADWTYKRSVICFNDAAEQLFQCKAADVAFAMSEDPSRAKEFFKDVLYKPHVLTLRVDFNDQYHQWILLNSLPLCSKLYNKYLCKKLDDKFKSS